MIVVFGAAGVLGTEIVRQLSVSGSEMMLLANSRVAETDKLAASLGGSNCYVQKCDVSNFEEVKSVFSRIEGEELGKVSAVINNFAYTFEHGGRKNYPASDRVVKKVFEVNYFGLSHILETITSVNDFCATAEPIRVINVLSNSLKTNNASNCHYIASKAASEQLSKYYAKHFAQSLVVNNIAPGLMKSKITGERFISAEKEIIGKTPLGRLATPSEVAELISYLALSAPIAITGETIHVDGGRCI